MGLPQALQRLLAGCRLPDFAYSGVLGQDLSEAGPDDGMIVRNQNSCAHHGSHPTER